ncbi:uncharacterized protein PG998_000487 [Apiospora kogelbergensis]|uniref:uncharacterized protein n=1 Tax=Apiospora kogelbergensis TaxID=1337665 RepID=UPI0031300226
MFDENFTFDQKGVADTSRRDHDEPESAMSPKEVYAELPPPPSLEAATQQSAAADKNNPPAGTEATSTTATTAETDTVDSLARQLGRQTLLQEDPQYQWRRSQQQQQQQPFSYEPGPFYDQRIVPRSSSPSQQSTQYLSPPRPPPSWGMRSTDNPSNNTRAIRANLIETMIANNYQCNVQTLEPATPVSASLPSFFPPGGSYSSSSSTTTTTTTTTTTSATNLDGGDTLMTDPNRSIQVDQDWGVDEPMVRLLSYRRAGAMTRVQKLGLSFRSAQHTALQCANLKPNKTRMRRRDRKPSKAQPSSTAPAPSAVGASST